MITGAAVRHVRGSRAIGRILNGDLYLARSNRLGAAYFIVLDNPNPGFDVFVNGKAIVRDAQRLSKLAKSLGLRAPEEYFSMSADDIEAMAGDFDLGEEPSAPPPERWFDAEEGIAWVAKLRDDIASNPNAVKNQEAVLSDLVEFERVFSQAKSIGAKWHFSIDF
jgi:hypothetical protein